MGKSFHFCLSVRGALKNRDFSGFTNDDGSKATPEQVQDFLLDQLAMGREVIPMSKDCKGFDYKTGCPGHEGEE